MKKTMKTLMVVLVLSILSSNMVFAISFEKIDLSEINNPSSWAKDEVEEARKAGLLTETTDNYFKEDITRIQFAELVVNMVEKTLKKEISPADKNTFVDTVDIGVLKAHKAGIVTGVSETEFAPSNYITREQIATMIFRALVYIEIENGEEYTIKDFNIDRYKDKDKVSNYAREGVSILANNGIMTGTSETTLAPKATTTVEQGILLVSRLFNRITK